MIGVRRDTRIGGAPVWRYCGAADLMRIPDELRDCVCFVHTIRNGQVSGMSTAFFVSLEIGMDDLVAVYAVTARHCLFDEDGTPDEVRLILNTRSGGIDYVKTTPQDWALRHPTADVAILPFHPDRSHFQYKVYPLKSAATKAVIEEKKVGSGDDVFVTGLLVHHPGESRIMPIVRLGCIAALPDDPVELTIGKYPGAEETEDVVGLLEVRSIGGLSGSPVFLHLPF